MSFIDFARSHGVDIDQSKFYPSDKIKRCGTIEKPRSLNGAFFWDGERGWVFNWGGEAKTVWYNDPNARPWTDEEKREWALKKNVQNTEQNNVYEKAALKADITLRSAKMLSHDYLNSKGFNDLKGLVIDNKLLIPMRNVVTNKLKGYQEIFFNYEDRKFEKKMLKGMRAKNAVFKIGSEESGEIWFVEGYATGLSLYSALKSCGINALVVVCFSASNLVIVSDQIKGKKFVFADNDESRTGERSARQTGLPWAMADQIGFDANDLHLKNGLFAVVKKIMETRKLQ